ncbi:MAG: MFS transporter, partial [Oscillospiraceae bacterium]|nr:MFS transporter [Oscillospiraceae bacterium]
FLIYITYGIIGGFGVGMAYNSVVSAAPKWFPKKRGLVTGISVFSFGFSTVVFAPLIEWMVAQVGVQNTFLILAGVFCAATLLLFKFIVTPESVATAPIQYSGRQYSSSAMLKTPQFYLIAITMMFGTAAYFVLNPSFVTMAQGRDLAEVATYLVMFTGIANALGRLALASLSDKIGPVKASIVIYAAMAVCIGLLTFATGWLLFAAISVIVFCYGGTSGVFMLMTGEYFGGKFQGANFGVVMLSFALSALVFPLLMGGVNDVIKFSILAVLAFIGVLIFVILPAIKKKNEK